MSAIYRSQASPFHHSPVSHFVKILAPIFEEYQQYDLGQSLREQPITWTIVTTAWLASCAVVWKLQLIAIERSSHRTVIQELI
jgi:hypothetical protein